MKILHTLHSAQLEGGGVIQAVLELSSALSELNIESEIATLDPKNVSVSNTCKTYLLGEKSSGYGYSKQFKLWFDQNIHQYDAVIIHGIWQYHSIATSQIAKKHKVPYFVYPHGMLDPWFAKTYPRKHLKKCIYWKLLEHRVFRDASYTCFTCEEEKLLAANSFSPFAITPAVTGLGIADPKNFAGVASDIHSFFPYLKNQSYLLYIGRLHEKKGIDLALQSFHDLAKNEQFDPKIQLVIAGPDNEENYKKILEKQIQTFTTSICERIHFTGMVTGEAKWSLLSNAQAMVLPSHQENFGIVVAEALALSVPVIISNQVNIWREIEQETAGFIGEDNIEGTKSAWLKWLDYSNKKDLPKQARSCFTKHFESKASALKLQNLLNQISVES